MLSDLGGSVVKLLQTHRLSFTKYIPNFTTVSKIWIDYRIVHGHKCRLINKIFYFFEGNQLLGVVKRGGTAITITPGLDGHSILLSSSVWLCQVLSSMVPAVDQPCATYGTSFLFFHLTSPQGQGHHNGVSQLLCAHIT